MNILHLLNGNFMYCGGGVICCRFIREVTPNGLATIKLNNNATVNFRERLLNTLNRITRFDAVVSLSDLHVQITENPNTGNRDVKRIYYRLTKLIDVYNADIWEEERNMVFRDEFTNVIISILTTGWWPESYNVTQRSNSGRSIREIDLGFYEDTTNIKQEQKFKDYMHGDALIDRINNCAKLCGSAKEIPIVIRSKDFTAKITDTSIEENVLYIDIEIDGESGKEEKEGLMPPEPRRRRIVRNDSFNLFREESPENNEEASGSEDEERRTITTAGDGLRAQMQRHAGDSVAIDPAFYDAMGSYLRTIDFGSFTDNGTITNTTER